MIKRPRRAYARVGWLMTTVALASALVISSWINYRGAGSAVVPLNRGQADLLEATVREALMRPEDGTVDAEDLTELVTLHGSAGLRYVGIGRDGVIEQSAGEAVLPMTLPQPGVPTNGPDDDDTLRPEQNRVRMVFPQPQVRRFPSGAPFDSAMRVMAQRGRQAGPSPRIVVTQGPEGVPQIDGAGPPDGPGRGFGNRLSMERQRHWVVLEIEPILANALMNRAERSLLVAIVGATILTLAALLFWRMSEKYAQARISLEEQRRLTVLGEMSAVLAHEIRNPLASLKGNAQLLAERLPADSKEKQRADRVVSEATRLEALTSDLLDFARTGPGELREVNPVELLRTSIGDVSEEGFTLDESGAPARWTMDATRIRQTLVNVLQNAQQATPNGKRPVARVSQEGSVLIYEVRDFGPGLPHDSADRIFDPFFTTRTNGTGLGLAVARRVAEMHGGAITARNHPEGGAIFRLELPRQPA